MLEDAVPWFRGSVEICWKNATIIQHYVSNCRDPDDRRDDQAQTRWDLLPSERVWRFAGCCVHGA